MLKRSFAGVEFPCFDCKKLHRYCGKQDDIIRKMVAAIASKSTVSCPEHEEYFFRGIEGCKA
jgi:predicted transcriptional regulator of viral defense system